ncbi:MAG: response regulator [Pseudomonadota bacterium]
MQQALKKPAEKRLRYPHASVLVVSNGNAAVSRIAANLQVMIGTVRELTTAREAWDLIRVEPIRVVFVDLELPSNDGITLLQCVRSLPETRHIPVVVLANEDAPAELNRALEAGATSHFSKPVVWSTFEAHVQHLLQLSDRSSTSEQLILEATQIVEETLQSSLAGGVGNQARPGAAHLLNTALASGTLPADISSAVRELRDAMSEQQDAVARLGQIIHELRDVKSLAS